MSECPLELTVPSEARYLVVVRSFVEAACQIVGLEAKATQALSLAVHEAAANVMRHAHRGRPELRLRLECHLRPHGIEVHLHDQGEPFDPAAAPHLDPSELRPGGRGIFLMRALVDELVCSPGPGGGNVLKLVKRRRLAPGRGADAG